MRKRISPDIDLKIIEGLSAGYSNNELAAMYGVSASYVSKLKTGKKVPYIHIVEPVHIKNEFFEVSNTDLNEIIAYIESKSVIVDKHEIIEYIETQLRKAIIKAKVYEEILRRIK